MPDIADIRASLEAILGGLANIALRIAELVARGITGEAPADPEMVRIVLVGGGTGLALVLLAFVLFLAPGGGRRRGNRNAPMLDDDDDDYTNDGFDDAFPDIDKIGDKISDLDAAMQSEQAGKGTASADLALAAIEEQMRNLKTLYESGKIPREVYIADSRTLYKRAKDIA